MHIGCPKEIKPQEFRVGLTPNAAREAVAHGHLVTVETEAGVGAGFSVSGWRGCSPAVLAEEPPLPPPQPARRLTASSSEQGNTEVVRAGARVSCSMANPLRESSRCGAPVVVMGTYVLIGTFVQLKGWEWL